MPAVVGAVEGSAPKKLDPVLAVDAVFDPGVWYVDADVWGAGNGGGGGR